MAAPKRQDREPKQTTPKGHEIPVPKRKEVMEFFKGVTGKRPQPENPTPQEKPDAL